MPWSFFFNQLTLLTETDGYAKNKNHNLDMIFVLYDLVSLSLLRLYGILIYFLKSIAL